MAFSEMQWGMEQSETNPEPKTVSVLLYDGECRFCRRWVRRIAWLCGDTLVTQPYQNRGPCLSGIPEEDLAEAVHLVDPSGRIRRGADAVLHGIAGKRGLAWLAACYRRCSLFSRCAEAVYRWVARNRRFLP